eukprot:Gb_35133 [translate_table: standard]
MDNQRLRDMLEQWSIHAAKMELALYAKHQSKADLHKKISKMRHSNVDSSETKRAD